MVIGFVFVYMYRKVIKREDKGGWWGMKNGLIWMIFRIG